MLQSNVVKVRDNREARLLKGREAYETAKRSARSQDDWSEL